ncbi:hypothetical protein NX862_17460 [Rhodobacter sp. KR11]|jgi:hypothetical protein|uniref:hypothetical protein n=1 Tax=Rhodobacter sp. KR11 TaxID=2974588 RepID=UPI0022213828|nr:hypothetical protein [Rhodobacter sp. KR11]MCW1920549.1 hypothetical protein [Rhodobacter sp. KR11]
MAPLLFTPHHTSKARTTAAEQSWPAGWWLLPAVVLGCGLWVLIFRLVASLF